MNGLDDRLTLVIADGKGADADARAVLEAWSRAGMLHELIWVERSGHSGDHIPASLMTAEGEREVDLLPELALRPLDLFQAVSLHVLSSTDDERPHPDLELRRRLRRVAAENGVTFRSGVLAVPAPGASVTSALFDPACTWNLVIEPAERRADGALSAPVSDDGLAGHAAAAVAAVAGAWRFCSRGPLDDLPGSALGNEAGVRVARAYTRLLDAGPVVDDVIDGILMPSLSWPPPAGLNPPARTFTGDASSYIDRAVEEMLTGAGLRYVAPEPSSVRPGTKLSAGAAIRLFVKRFGEVLSGLPLVLADEVQDATQKRIEEVARGLYPSDSEILVHASAVGEGPDAGLDALLDALRIADLPGADVEVADQRLWEDLRQVCFGMVDGGTFPAYVTPPGEGMTRRSIGRPGVVAPSPHADPEFAALGLTVRCCDPAAARQLQARIRSAADGSTRSGSRLTSWLAQRQSTFLWKLGLGIDDEIRAASVALADAWKTIADGPPRPSGGRAATLRRKAVALAIALLLSLLVPVVLWRMDVDLWPNVGASAAVLLLWMVVATIVISRHAAAEARISFQRRKRQSEWHDAVATAREATAALTRLGVAYRQLVDWGEIIGGVLHAPWGGPGERREPPAIDVADRPLSVVLARGEPKPDEVQSQVALGQRRLMAWGWMSAAYGRLAAVAKDRYALVAAAEDPSVVDPDLDVQPSETVVGRHSVTGEPILNPRSDLRRAVRENTHRDALRAGPSEALREGILGTSPDRLVGAVRTADGIPLDEADASSFLGGIIPDASASAPFPRSLFAARGTHISPVLQVMTLPPSIRSGDQGATASIIATARGERLVLGSCRVDVTDLLRTREIAVVDGGPAPTPPPEPDVEFTGM